MTETIENPFADFEVVDVPEVVEPPKITCEITSHGKRYPLSWQSEEEMQLFLSAAPIVTGEVGIAYWHGTRPGDPRLMERSTFLLAGRPVKLGGTLA